MKRIETFIQLVNARPPSHRVTLHREQLSAEEWEWLQSHPGEFVLLNTSAGWWRFFAVEVRDERMTLTSSGAPGQHASGSTT